MLPSWRSDERHFASAWKRRLVLANFQIAHCVEAEHIAFQQLHVFGPSGGICFCWKRSNEGAIIRAIHCNVIKSHFAALQASGNEKSILSACPSVKPSFISCSIAVS